jgi:hypothetical protein
VGERVDFTVFYFTLLSVVGVMCHGCGNMAPCLRLVRVCVSLCVHVCMCACVSSDASPSEN